MLKKKCEDKVSSRYVSIQKNAKPNKGYFSTSFKLFMIASIIITLLSVSYVLASPIYTSAVTLNGTDSFYYDGQDIYFFVNFANVYNGTQGNVTLNCSELGGGDYVLATNISGNMIADTQYMASCTLNYTDLESSSEFTDITSLDNITFTATNATGSINTTYFQGALVLYNFTVPDSIQDPELRFGSMTTNMSQVTDFNDVNYVIDVQANWSGSFETIALYNFSSLNMSHQSIATQLSNLGSGIGVMPGENTNETAYIFLNSTMLANFNSSAKLSLYDLPFKTLPNLTSPDGGSINDSFTYVYEYGNGQGNLTFAVNHFTTYNIFDAIDPVITINSPIAESNITSNSFLINVTMNGTSSSINNGSITYTLANQSMTLTYSYPNMTCLGQNNDEVLTCNLTSTLSDGSYTLLVNASDLGQGTGNSNSKSINFTLDATAPKFTSSGNLTQSSVAQSASTTFYIYTTDGTGTGVKNNATANINIINYTTDTNLDFGTISFPGTTNLNHTLTSTNLTSLKPGTYTYNGTVSVWDNAGNLNTTDIALNFTVTESVSPTITVLSPTVSVSTDNTPLINVTFNDTETGSGISNTSIAITIDSTTYTLANLTCTDSSDGSDDTTCNLTPSALSDSNHTIIFNVTDKQGNTNSSVIYYYSDATAPIFTSSGALTSTSVGQSDQTTFYIGVNDAAIGVKNNATANIKIINYTTDTNLDFGTISFSSTSSLNHTLTSTNLTSLKPGTYTYNGTVSVWDNAGNLNTTDVALNFTVTESISPKITVLSPTVSVSTDNTPLINVTFNDTETGSGISNTSIAITIDSTTYTLANLTCTDSSDGSDDTTCNLTPSALSDSNHTIIFNVTDKQGNTNSSVIYYYSDATAPFFTSSGALTSTSVGQSDQTTFYIGVTDAAIGVKNNATANINIINYTTGTNLDFGTISFTGTTSLNHTLTSTNLSDLSAGTYTYNGTVYVWDNLGNLNTTDIALNFTVIDNANPSVVFHAPTSTLSTDNTPLVNFTVDDTAAGSGINNNTLALIINSSLSYTVSSMTCTANSNGMSTSTCNITLPALADGTYTFAVNATDLQNNNNYTTKSYIVDTTKPVVTSTSLSSSAVQGQAITLTANGVADTTTSVTKVNGTFNIIGLTVANNVSQWNADLTCAGTTCTYDYNTTSLPAGLYNFNGSIFAYDNLSNKNTTSIGHNFTITETTAPTLWNISANYSKLVKNNNITVKIFAAANDTSYVDEIWVKNPSGDTICSFGLANAASVSGSKDCVINATTSTSYTISIYANDTLGNTVSTPSTITFTVEDSAINVNSISVPTSAYADQQFNVTASVFSFYGTPQVLFNFTNATNSSMPEIQLASTCTLVSAANKLYSCYNQTTPASFSGSAGTTSSYEVAQANYSSYSDSDLTDTTGTITITTNSEVEVDAPATTTFNFTGSGSTLTGTGSVNISNTTQDLIVSDSATPGLTTTFSSLDPSSGINITVVFRNSTVLNSSSATNTTALASDIGTGTVSEVLAALVIDPSITDTTGNSILGSSTLQINCNDLGITCSSSTAVYKKDFNTTTNTTSGTWTKLTTSYSSPIITVTVPSFSIFAVATPVTSTPPSGGGGGGGSYSTTYAVGLTSQAQEKTISRGDRIRFSYLNEYHTITLNTVSSGKATITIASSPTTYILEEGEYAQKDLDNDGDYDLEVTLVDTSNSRATLSIKKLNGEQVEESVVTIDEDETISIDEEDQSQTEDTGSAQGSQEETVGSAQSEGSKDTEGSAKSFTSEEKTKSYTGLAITALVIIAGLGIYFYFAKPKA